jgi:hypothetical protein
MSRPSKSISPLSTSTSFTRQRAMVDLPEPLADDAQRLAAAQGEADVIDGVDHALGREPATAPDRFSSGCARLQHRLAAAIASASLRRQRRHGRDQASRVGMLRRVQHLVGRPTSTSTPCSMTATRSAISATTPKSWVMNSTPMAGGAAARRLPALIDAQLQDLRLRRDVERGGRLVGDQQRRLQGEGHGDHHALPLAARELGG